MVHRAHSPGPAVGGRTPRGRRAPLVRPIDPEQVSLRANDLGFCALGTAVQRLESIAPDGILQAICRELLGDSLCSRPGGFTRLPESLRETLLLNGLEWLVADGMLHDPAMDMRRHGLELVLGDPALRSTVPADERCWLHEVGQREVQLFRVGPALRGKGLALHDPIDRGRAPLWVCAPQGNDGMAPGSICALRPIRFEGAWTLSLTRYCFASTFYGVSVALALREEHALCEAQPGESAEMLQQRLRWARSVTIARAWLDEREELAELAQPARRRPRRRALPRPRRPRH